MRLSLKFQIDKIDQLKSDVRYISTSLRGRIICDPVIAEC